jgi:hypothetical protein
VARTWWKRSKLGNIGRNYKSIRCALPTSTRIQNKYRHKLIGNPSAKLTFIDNKPNCLNTLALPFANPFRYALPPNGCPVFTPSGHFRIRTHLNLSDDKENWSFRIRLRTDCAQRLLPLAWVRENPIVDCRRKIATIQRHEARGALSVCKFRLSLRDKNRPGAFCWRPGRAKFALLLW